MSGKALEEKVDDITGLTRKTVVEAKGELLKPMLELVDANGQVIMLPSGREATYPLPVGATVGVDVGAVVNAGDILAEDSEGRNQD